MPGCYSAVPTDVSGITPRPSWNKVFSSRHHFRDASLRVFELCRSKNRPILLDELPKFVIRQCQVHFLTESLETCHLIPVLVKVRQYRVDSTFMRLLTGAASLYAIDSWDIASTDSGATDS